ncbi:hypothetical protein J6590_100076 [Homalodisca vitripennis]|nr:hypothetical protein J6590_100076 [Homalodisca vitripennis]
MDMLRIKKANKAVDEIEKKCRRQTTLAKKMLEDDYEAEEADNPSYGRLKLEGTLVQTYVKTPIGYDKKR